MKKRMLTLALTGLLAFSSTGNSGIVFADEIFDDFESDASEVFIDENGEYADSDTVNENIEIGESNDDAEEKDSLSDSTSIEERLEIAENLEKQNLFADSTIVEEDVNDDFTNELILSFDGFRASALAVSVSQERTRDEAIAWVYAQEGKGLDYDGAYGNQCVDLIKYYYDYFGVASYARGNGCDYVTNALPDGWSRIQYYSGFRPEPGDIAVWGTNYGQGYGHVSIVLSAGSSNFVSMDQNWGAKYCKQVTHAYNIWGVIRPKYKDADPYINVDTNFYAYIINSASGKHITRNDAGEVFVWSETGDANQVWYFERQGDGSYKISSCQDKKCLDGNGSDFTNGAEVRVYDSNETSAQRWFIYGESGKYQFRAVCGENYLDMYGGGNDPQNGTKIQMFEKNGTSAQDFQIQKLSKVNSTHLNYSDGTDYKVTSFWWNEINSAIGYDLKIWNGPIWEGDPYKVISMSGTGCQVYLPAGYYEAYVDTWNKYSVSMSDNVVKFTVYEENPIDVGTDFYAYIINTAAGKYVTRDENGEVFVTKETGQANQVWKFERQGDGSYKILSSRSTLCLDGNGSDFSNGADVRVYESNETSAQRWFIYGSSSKYHFRALCGNNALDMTGGGSSPADGTQMEMWQKNGSTAQDFQIQKLPSVSAPTVTVSTGTGTAPTTFYWTKADHATQYTLKIWKGTVWEGDPYQEVHNLTDTSYALTLPAGYYEAYVDASNNYSYLMSQNVVKFTVKDAAKVVSNSLILDGKIGVNFYVALPENIVSDTGACAVINCNGTDHITKVSEAQQSVSNGVLRYKFTYYVAAKEMQDTLTLQLMDGKGNVVALEDKEGNDVTSGYKYSVQAYLDAAKERGSAAIKPLATAMEDYGICAQIYLDYNASGLSASKTVTDVTAAQLQAYCAAYTGTLMDSIKNTSTLILDTDTSIRQYFNFPSGKSVSDYSFTIDGKKVTPQFKDKYYTAVENIAAKDLDVFHTFTISKGSATYTIKFSALSYAQKAVNTSKASLQNMAKSLYLYNQAAKAYFGD